MPDATIMAGLPSTNMTLYHALRFMVGDPTVLICAPDGDGKTHRTMILRDIEMQRAKKHAHANSVHCPIDFAPSGGLSAERETATAQAAAECLGRIGAKSVTADRTLPLIYAHHIESAGIELVFDEGMGVMDRRAKDAGEIEMLREAQAATEEAMRMACETVARAEVGSGGVLMSEGTALTSERVSSEIDVFLMKRGYSTPMNIVAGGREGSDCHNRGSGELQTGEPVIIDIFPQNKKTLYNGDCTRTVVNGDVPDGFAKMHAAVAEAKTAGIAATRAGVTCDAVYRASMEVIEKHGWSRGILEESGPADACSMQHGLGHGIGLDVHEAPLVDVGGPELVAGDALTIEPGLYHATIGGVRLEDMVIVTADGCENLNNLPEGLDWR